MGLGFAVTARYAWSWLGFHQMSLGSIGTCGWDRLLSHCCRAHFHAGGVRDCDSRACGTTVRLGVVGLGLISTITWLACALIRIRTLLPCELIGLRGIDVIETNTFMR